MPNLTADEIVTNKHKRLFIQFGGPYPGNVVKYYGQDAQYMSVEGVGLPGDGTTDPIYVHSPTQIGKRRLVGRSTTEPEIPSATIIMREKHGAIPRQLIGETCPFNVYEPTGKCKDLSDFLKGWDDYVLIYSSQDCGAVFISPALPPTSPGLPA